MRCPRCDGEGTVPVTFRARKYGLLYSFLDHARPYIPCPECLGARIVHCCDGLAEQPDADH